MAEMEVSYLAMRSPAQSSSRFVFSFLKATGKWFKGISSLLFLSFHLNVPEMLHGSEEI